MVAIHSQIEFRREPPDRAEGRLRPPLRLVAVFSTLLLSNLVVLTGCTRPDRSDDTAQNAALEQGNGPLGAALPPPSSDGLFTDVTRAAGISARHRLPTSDLRNIVDAVGAGAAFADLDGDSWLDLIVLGGPRSPEADRSNDVHAGLRIYRNLKNGRFEDVTIRSQIPPDSTAVAVAVADIDGDGDRDLYLVDRGPNRLYRNRGNAIFDDITDAAGVGDAHFGVGAAFFDKDRDGDLDLYVTNYLDFDPRENAFYAPDGFPGPLTYKAEPDVLYENRGDGTFEDVSSSSGVDTLIIGRGMSLASADFDDDGDTDLFVANDATENFLLLNDGGGRFSEAGLLSGVAVGENGEETAAMASDVGDVNGDGQLDLVVSDTAYGSLYLRESPGLFVDHAMRSGIGMLCGQYVSWGQNLFDFDHDGDLDLFVANGGLHHLVGWEDLLLRNTGAAHFEDASKEGGQYFASRHVGRSSIIGDYDNDGDMDVFVTTLNGRHFLLRNDLPKSSAWITLDLVGRHVRDAFGARVEVTAGGRTYVSESRFPSAYLGQSDGRIHVGLGKGVAGVDSIRITWATGASHTLSDVPAGQILQIEEGTG